MHDLYLVLTDHVKVEQCCSVTCCVLHPSAPATIRWCPGPRLPWATGGPSVTMLTSPWGRSLTWDTKWAAFLFVSAQTSEWRTIMIVFSNRSGVVGVKAPVRSFMVSSRRVQSYSISMLVWLHSKSDDTSPHLCHELLHQCMLAWRRSVCGAAEAQVALTEAFSWSASLNLVPLISLLTVV